MTSKTLHQGGKIVISYNDALKAFDSLDFEGDHTWGRKGRYPTSFFLFPVILRNKVVGFDIDKALQQFPSQMDFLKSSWRNFADSDKEDLVYRENVFNGIMTDWKTYSEEDATTMSSKRKVEIMEDLCLKWLDLHVHSPLVFIEMPNDDNNERLKQEAKQREALKFLDAMEKKLSQKP